MSEPAKDPADPLNYAAPEKPSGVGCLILAMLFSVFVSLLCGQAIFYMIGDHHLDYVLILLAFPVLLIFIARRTHKPGRSLAFVIVMISLMTLLLMMGLCANVPIISARPPKTPTTATLPATTR